MSAFKVGDKVRCEDEDGAFDGVVEHRVAGVWRVYCPAATDLQQRYYYDHEMTKIVIDPQEWTKHCAAMLRGAAGYPQDVLAVWCLIELARSGRIIWGHDKPKPEWVRLTTTRRGHDSGTVLAVKDWWLWEAGDVPAYCPVVVVNANGEDTILYDPVTWEPADPPEPTVTIEIPLFAAKFHAEFRPAPGELNPYYAVSAACRTALGDQ